MIIVLIGGECIQFTSPPPMTEREVIANGEAVVRVE